jgi:hypothetical protein
MTLRRAGSANERQERSLCWTISDSRQRSAIGPSQQVHFLDGLDDRAPEHVTRLLSESL